MTAPARGGGGAGGDLQHRLGGDSGAGRVGGCAEASSPTLPAMCVKCPPHALRLQGPGLGLAPLRPLRCTPRAPRAPPSLGFVGMAQT